MGLLIAAASASAYSTVLTSAGPTIATPEAAAVIPGGDPTGIASDGADGVWFSDVEAKAYLTHYSPSRGSLTPVDINRVPPDNGQTFGIAPGLKGEEWFTREGANQVAHIKANGTIVNKTLPTNGSAPYDVAVDKQGNAWFIARGECWLGRLSPAGALKEYRIGSSDDCFALTVGPDGNIWLAAYIANEYQVLDVSATNGATLASYKLGPVFDITSSGNTIWAAAYNASQIVAISSTGQVSVYALPGNRLPRWITAAPDGAAWFAEGNGPASGEEGIGRITSTGALSETAVPDGSRHVWGIAATNDAVYFTQSSPEPGLEPGIMRIPLSNLAEPDEASYVALGDSYSSGEGNQPYEAGSTPPPNPDPGNPSAYNTCHRSQAAYGPLVDGARALGPMIFKACSGAVTEDFFNENPNNAPEPAQLSWLRSNDKTVTLTVGGNDAGFVHVVSKCVEGPRGSVPFYQPFGCSKDKGLRAETEVRLKALEGTALAFTPPPEHRPIRALTEVIKAVRSHAINARIVIGGYPHLFGPSESTYELGASPSGKVCLVGTAQVPSVGPVPLLVDYRDALWLNKLAGQLDTAIQRAVKAAQAEGTPVSYAPPRFSVHGLCASGEPWLNAVELDSANEVEPGSFHPNATGQRLAYEPAFASLLK